MRALVAGADGFLGRAVVSALASHGHEVVALVHHDRGARPSLGPRVTTVVGDLLEPSTLGPALRGVDLAVHLAQAPASDLGHMRRVRVEGGRNLVAAVAAEGAKRVLVGSGYWVYRDSTEPIVEASPVAPMSLSSVNFEAEEVAREAGRKGGVSVGVVRPGMVYGDGSWFGEMVAELGRSTYRYLGDGTNFLSPIHLDDLGEAFRCLAERGDPTGLYLVVDDAPVDHRTFAEFVAERLGVPKPQGVPFEEAERDWGREIALLNAASRRASNARLRSTGWAPRYPSYREGVPEVLRRMAASRSRRLSARRDPAEPPLRR